MSPTSIADESISANQDLVQHKLRYVLYKLEHNEMVVDKKGDASTSEHTDFIAALPQDKCRYATYVFEYGSEQGKRSKLLGVVWMPDAASVRDKMLYSSNEESFTHLGGIQGKLHATEQSELCLEHLMSKFA